MPRFQDTWVIDRVLFDYYSGGSCACCGNLFLPNGTADLVKAVSDLDTDQADAEVAALNQHHPWPVELRDQVWADRVRVRQYFKKDMRMYHEFWQEHGEEFVEWLLRQKSLQRLFQVPRSEIMEEMRVKYKIHSAYGVVLCAVAEQVAFFDLTGYKVDGRGDEEVGFEKILKFDKRGGFTVDFYNNDGELDEKVFDAWIRRMKSLGGPKLLERGPSSSTTTTTNEGDVDGPQPASTTSFQSDRRIVRLMIAKYWANLLQKKYLDGLGKSPEEETG